MAVVGLEKASISSIRRQIERMQTENDNAEKKIRSALNGLDFEVASKQNIRNCLSNLAASANKQGGLSARYKSAFLSVTGSLTESDAKFGSRSQSIFDRIKKYTYAGIRSIGDLFTRNKFIKYAATAGLFLANPGVAVVTGVLSSDKVKSTCVKAGKKCVSAVRKEFLNEDGSFDYEKLKQYGKAALKVGKSVVKIVGAVSTIAGALALASTGAGIPAAIAAASPAVVSIISAGNDFVNAFTDMAYVHEEQYDMVGQTNVLKDYLTDASGDIGGYLGNREVGEKIGAGIYTGIDIVTFLDGAEKMIKSLGKVNTIVTGTTGYSSILGKTSFDDIIDSKIKFDFEPDYFIRKILKTDPASDANIVYEAAKSVWKMFGKAAKVGKEIGGLA